MPRAFQGTSCFDCVSGRRRAVTFAIPDETKPTLMQRANETLVVAAGPERAPGRADARAQRRLRDDASLPNRLEQLVLAHDSIAVAHEVNKEVEQLRLAVDHRAGAPALPACEA